MIIATAGHVDHGKTALVRALTGVDTDRLPEEKARGLTIDIGFAYLRLPDCKLLGVVDVPGHQRFVHNMLAGVGNVDHALIVVAADDGVMPQTVEHVDILGLLGVASATVAITKIDLVEAGRCDEIEGEIRALLTAAGIAATRLIRTSVRSGEGIAALHRHLTAAAQVHMAAPPTGRFRVAIDRAFVLRGVGVVATGSVHAGTAQTGETVTIAPAALAARLRGLRIHDAEVSSVRAGDRCAMHLAGIALDQVRRGHWIVAGPNVATQRLDVHLRLLAGQRPVRHWTPAHVHIGAEDITGRISLVDRKRVEPGETALAALHLDRPVAAWAGQRFILRDQSAQQTIGGGRVLDPLPPARQDLAVRLARLGALNAPDATAAFAGMLEISPRGFDVEAFASAWSLTAAEARGLLAADPVVSCRDGDMCIVIRCDHWQALCGEIVDVLAAHHGRHSDQLGLNDKAIGAALRPAVAKPVLRLALATLREAGTLARKGTILHLAAHRVQPTAAELSLWNRVEPALASGGVRPPRVRELADLTALTLEAVEAHLARAEQLGWVHRVASNRFYLPEALEELERMAGMLAAESPDGTFTAADFNRISDIGRNLTIQVLEYLDRIGVTKRDGDRRQLARLAAPEDSA